MLPVEMLTPIGFRTCPATLYCPISLVASFDFPGDNAEYIAYNHTRCEVGNDRELHRSPRPNTTYDRSFSIVNSPTIPNVPNSCSLHKKKKGHWYKLSATT